MNPLQPRPLSQDDPLKKFRCGNSDLDTWLCQRASRNEKTGDSRTYVSIDEDSGDIAGFYCLSAGTVSRSGAAGWLTRNAPDPVPVVLLGRLAVSLDAQNVGIGKQLVADSLSRANVAAQIVGARALVTQAKDEYAAAFYCHLGFSMPIPTRPLTLCFKLR